MARRPSGSGSRRTSPTIRSPTRWNLATTIASKSPHAIRAGKRLVESAYAEDFAAGFAHEREEIFSLIGTPNQVESVTAYFEKRAPNYAEVEVEVD